MWPGRRKSWGLASGSTHFLAVRARSRFTRLPGRRSARAERFKVSCITSAVKPAGEKAVAVRHTPLTAMLSPMWRSSSTTWA